jgi:hypothetical protein
MRTAIAGSPAIPGALAEQSVVDARDASATSGTA